MAQLSIENIPQVKLRNTCFSLIFDSNYWIHFGAEDAKKPQNFKVTLLLYLQKKPNHLKIVLVGYYNQKKG